MEFWRQIEPPNRSEENQNTTEAMASDQPECSRFSTTTDSTQSTQAPSVFSDGDLETVETVTSIEQEASPRKPVPTAAPTKSETSNPTKTKKTFKDETPTALEVDNLALSLLEDSTFQHAVRKSSTHPALNEPGSELSQTQSIEVLLPRLFDSLCICDPNIPGHPIKLRSQNFSIGPRGLKVRRCEFLNLPLRGSGGDDCFISSRPSGGDGRQRFVLEYAAAFVSQETTQSESCVVASLMDLTQTMRALAAEMLSRQAERERWERGEARHDPSMGLGSLCGDHDHDAFLAVRDAFLRLRTSVDWLEVAAADAAADDEDQPHPDDGSPTRAHTARARLSPADPALLNLSEVIEDVRFFHRDALILSQAKNTGFWQISAASRSLAGDAADLRAGLGATPPEVLGQLGAALSGRVAVSFEGIRWGVSGVEKRVYCVPMSRGGEVGCWICFLVDGRVPDLWDL